MNIPFSPPDMSELEIGEVGEALRSGWITTGPRTKKFEAALAEVCRCDKVVCLNSATAALEMILHVLNVGEGDEVITSAYTYTASASPAIHVGASLKFIDTATDSFEMDYDALEAAISEKTKVIVPVDIGGALCDYDRIFEIVERKKALFRPNGDVQEALGRIVVVADCAHALGGMRNGKMAGEIADFSSFSFHAVKNLTTAEGGCAAWKSISGIDNEDIYHRFQLLSLHGQSKDALAKSQLGAWEYDVIYPAYKCNMTDIMAAIGLKQLERYEGMMRRRHEIIRRYDAAFCPLGVKTLCHESKSHLSSGHLYLTRTPGIADEQRREIIVKMAEAHIACNVHYKPLPMMTAYKNLGFDIKDFPRAFAQFENEITLPLHTRLTDIEVDYIIENFSRILGEYI
ncbi:MAG: DegT/DnrJ/EryC1/StrS aminotransferase family protein [Clostridia bacterium]|nr:DegT/DnrJ/EryC1/StrS aminotransferase family protein [Clostridia bacterium]